MADQDEQKRALVLPWPFVGVAGILVGVSGLAAVGLAIAIGNVSGLATVALSLAILAFVCQLLIYIAGTLTSGQQRHQQEALYSDTRSLLAEIRTTTSGSHAVLKDQFEMVLRAALRRGIKGAGSVDLDLSDFENSVTKSVERVLQDQFPPQVRQIAPAEPASFNLATPSEEDEMVLNQLSTWPTPEEASAIYERLSRLPLLVVAQLVQYGEDERRSRAVGIKPGLYLGKASPLSDYLADEGLIAKTMVDRDGEPHPYASLTDEGRHVMRLILAPAPVPDYVTELLK